MILGLTFIGLRYKLCASGSGFVGDGADHRISAGRLRTTAHGEIHDANGDWQIPLLAVALISVVMALFGALAGRDREING